MALPTAKEREAFIRAYAASIGIDPDVAVKVARSEGLRDGVWQSGLQQPYGREQSYGDFQLHNAPEGRRPGMGNAYQHATGNDPSDPANWQSMDRYALDQARQQGWGPWMGAKAVGVTGKMGIGQAPGPAPLPARPTETVAQPTGILDPTAAPTAVAADEDPTQSGNMWTGYHDRWAALGDMAQKYAEKSAAREDEKLPPPPAVLQPLVRFKLGKGLLG
jgi:hypothetical protein